MSKRDTALMLLGIPRVGRHKREDSTPAITLSTAVKVELERRRLPGAPSHSAAPTQLLNIVRRITVYLTHSRVKAPLGTNGLVQLRTRMIRARKSVIGDAGRTAWAGEVDQALRMLGRDEQSFIRLSYFGGLDQARIAERAGVSLTAVSQTLASGMRALGRAIESLRVGSPAPRHAANDADSSEGIDPGTSQEP